MKINFKIKSMEEFYKSLGFESAQEAHKLIAGFNMSNPELRQKFEKWKTEDGTKEGLLKLMQPDSTQIISSLDDLIKSLPKGSEKRRKAEKILSTIQVALDISEIFKTTGPIEDKIADTLILMENMNYTRFPDGGVSISEPKNKLDRDVLICPKCESSQTTIIYAESVCYCDDCDNEFKA